MTRERALDVIAHHYAANAVARLLDVTGWPVRAMPVADREAIRRRVEELRQDLAEAGADHENAYDALLGRTT